LIKSRRFLAKLVIAAKALFWQLHHQSKMACPKTGADHFTLFNI